MNRMSDFDALSIMRAMERLVNAVINALAKELGEDLENAYLYGSLAQRTYEMGQSDINLLLVVSENLSIHTLRGLFLPLWPEYGRRLGRAPLVATRRTLARYLLLNPVFSDHLVRVGQPLVESESLPTVLPAQTSAQPHDICAYLAHQAMLVSPALVPELYTPQEQIAHVRKLHSLARHIFGQAVDPQETAVSLFARIQEHLSSLIHALPDYQPWESTRTATSPMLPGLQATYTKDLEKLILVFNQITAVQFANIGWDKLAARLAKDYTGLYMTTSTQLRLISELETPLDLFFKRNAHTWGEDPLSSLQTSKYHKLRQAARRPAQILVESLPHAYLTSADNALSTVIHDFQNKLLNVQLENELLSRMGLIQHNRPPEPLPGREAPATERIQAIFAHLDWWAGHFTNGMLQVAAADTGQS